MSWEGRPRRRSFKRAIGAQPSTPSHTSSRTSSFELVRHEEARQSSKRPARIDPLSSMMNCRSSGAYLLCKAATARPFPLLQAGVAIDPDSVPPYYLRAWYISRPANPMRRRGIPQGLRLAGGNILQMANQGFVLGGTGRRARKAQQIIATSARSRKAGLFHLIPFAHWSTRLGEIRDASIRVAGDRLTKG